MKATVILGAGFSKNSGLPVQSEIALRLISDAGSGQFDYAAVIILKRFMSDVFGYDGTGNVPNLDDIFTCIDISTNSGHHLGIKYDPVYLRIIRRLFVYRLFCVLEECFEPSADVASFIGNLHNSFSSTGYLVLNWDTVLESYLLSMPDNIKIDYCNGGRLLGADDSQNAVARV